jgi:serine/threonine protein kinase
VARQTSLSRVVALKMVLSGVYSGEVERKRLVNEARSIAHLKHPNIVQVTSSTLPERVGRGRLLVPP